MSAKGNFGDARNELEDVRGSVQPVARRRDGPRRRAARRSWRLAVESLATDVAAVGEAQDLDELGTLLSTTFSDAQDVLDEVALTLSCDSTLSRQNDHTSGTRPTPDDEEPRQQRQPELPVVAEAVAARPHHHQVRRRRDRGQERGGGGDGERTSAPAAPTRRARRRPTTAIGMTMSAVAVLLISWPSTAVSTNSPISSGVRRRRRRPCRPGARRAGRRRRSAASPSTAGSCRATSTTVVHEIAR